MAIVEMKRMSLLAPKKDEKALLGVIQRLGCVQVTPTDEEYGFGKRGSQMELSALDDMLTRVHWSVDRLERVNTTKKPMFADKPSITTDEAQELLEDNSRLVNVIETLEALERENGDLRGKATRLQSRQEQLAPWVNLHAPLSSIKNTRHTQVMLGTVQHKEMEALLASGELSPLCTVEVVSTVWDTDYICVVVHRDAAEESLSRLREIGFTQVVLSGFSECAAACLQKLDKELAAIEERQKAILADTALHLDALPKLKAYYDALGSEREQLTASQEFLASQSTFYLQGWAPDTMTEKLEKSLHKISPVASLEFSEPAEGEEPPVLLHNGPVVSPYESVVSGFSLPSYSGYDPTAIMMPFFANFMGMMVSDAGYGLLLVMVLVVVIRAMKPAPGTKRMMKILIGGGIATIIWGALYNTWFGFAPLPSLFDPINNPLPVMGLCVGLGALHLFTGLGVAAYMNIKRGKPLAAVADQLSWFMLVLGLIIMVLPMFVPDISAAITSAGQYLAIAGVVVILVTSGREKSRNPIKRLMSGLGALYGATSWISDLLSYMRLFGMGLATGVIGMVFNQLVGMVFSTGPIGWVLGSVLFVFCHLFNIGINVLGAYVHSCRLQYIEFFGKFYEEGGKPFKPLSAANRYCYIQDAPERA